MQTLECRDIMSMNWQAIGAVATASAAIIALYPIYKGYFSRRSRAVNLRMRLVTKLFRMRPTLNQIAKPDDKVHPYFVIMEPPQFNELNKELENLLAESETLEPTEQDRISQIVANLSLMIPAMETENLPQDGAMHIVTLIDEAINELESHGLVHGIIREPWAE